MIVSACACVYEGVVCVYGWVRMDVEMNGSWRSLCKCVWVCAWRGCMSVRGLLCVGVRVSACACVRLSMCVLGHV